MHTFRIFGRSGSVSAVLSNTQCDSLLIATRGAAASCRSADTPFCIRPGNRKEGRKQGRKESGGGGDGDPWHHAGRNEMIKPTNNRWTISTVHRAG